MKVTSRGKVSNPRESMLVLRDSTFASEDFSRRNLDAFRAIACSFTDCKFEFMQVRDMGFASGPQETLYRRCSFDGSKLKVGAVGPVRFEDCSFMEVDIKDLMCGAAEFVRCKFSGILRSASFSASITHLYRQYTNRDQNEFSGNDFRFLRMRDSVFLGGVDLRDQLLPSGPDYLRITNAKDKVAFLERAVHGWTDEKEKRDANGILKTLTVIIQTGQVDLFVTKDSFARVNKVVAAKLFALLE